MRALLRHRAFAVPARLLAAATLAFAFASAARAEEEPVLDAAQLLQPERLSGPGWVVESRVPVRGYQARFIVRSEWGDFEADSVDLLAVRIAEMPALQKLHGTGVTAVLLESAGERAMEPVQAMGAIARQPVRTATGLPRGVARYFSERWEKLRSRAGRLGERGRDLVMESGSPYDNPDGPMGASGDDSPRHERSWWQRRGRDVSREAKRQVAVPKARQSLARRLGIDPSTRHPLIAPRLDALAWAEATGRFATGEALDLLGAEAVDIMSQAMQVNRLVLESPPEVVRERNRALLAVHCGDDRLLDAFVRDGAYSPNLQTQFTDLFVALGAAGGCEALLETALMAGDEPQARFIVNGLRLLSHQLGEEARGGRFVPQGALLAYETPSGEFVLPLAVDWLAWTPEIRRWFELPAIDTRPRRMLLVGGAMSPLAQRELTTRGWSLVSRLPYPGAPPYRRPLDFASAGDDAR